MAEAPGTSVVQCQSSTFDIAGNLASAQDADRLARSLAPVCQVMDEHECDFDEARLHMVLQAMAAMGIDDSGLPSDPKLVMFSSPCGSTTTDPRRCSRGMPLRSLACFRRA
jgi:hypothetical protein